MFIIIIKYYKCTNWCWIDVYTFFGVLNLPAFQPITRSKPPVCHNIHVRIVAFPNGELKRWNRIYYTSWLGGTFLREKSHPCNSQGSFLYEADLFHTNVTWIRLVGFSTPPTRHLQYHGHYNIVLVYEW